MKKSLYIAIIPLTAIFLGAGHMAMAISLDGETQQAAASQSESCSGFGDNLSSRCGGVIEEVPVESPAPSPEPSPDPEPAPSPTQQPEGQVLGVSTVRKEPAQETEEIIEPSVMPEPKPAAEEKIEKPDDTQKWFGAGLAFMIALLAIVLLHTQFSLRKIMERISSIEKKIRNRHRS